MWRGFLYRGNYNYDVMKKLFNNLKNLFITISSEDEELIKAFCFKAASIAIYCEIEETKDRKWIMEMIKLASDKVKAIFADELQRELFKLDTNKTDELWNDWIRKYWEERNKNFPTQLTQEEIEAMGR